MNDKVKDLAKEAIQFFVDLKAHCGANEKELASQVVDRGQRASAFYGPESTYLKALEGWCTFTNIRGGLSADDLIALAPTVHKELTDAVVDRDLITKIAAHRLAIGGADVGPALKELQIAFSTQSDEKLVSVLDHERDWANTALENIGASGVPKTVGEWRCLTFANANADSDPLRHVERTPIFLAKEREKKGFVLYLVAERLPGPAIVTPHWWRIGSVPLTDDLVNELHRGFEKVMKSLEGDKDRFQIRWWLERDKKKGWPKAIAHLAKNTRGEEVPANPSVNAAAACLALALKEKVPSDQRPLLDKFAGVSASLNDEDVPAGTRLLDWPIGSVGHVEQKCSDAHEAKLDAFLLSEDCRKENADVLVEKKNEHIVSVLGRRTLQDAYESLLVTGTKIKAAKSNSTVTRDNDSPDDWFAKHICTPTAQEYVDASSKSEED